MEDTLKLAYNTDNNNLIIPEYGRNVHRMVQHAMTISDKNERNKCAETIVKVMDLINPNSKKNSNTVEHQQKLWSQLFIISNFQLDVDSPYGTPKTDKYKSRPESVPYPSNDIKYGHYGKIMEDMIKAAAELEDSENRSKLVKHIANLLKTSYLQWNRDSVSDSLIIKQLEELSNGKLTVSSDDLRETNDIVRGFKKKKTSKNYSKNKNRRKDHGRF